MKTLKNMRRKNLCITLGLVSLLSGGANAALERPPIKATETIRLTVTNDCPVTISTNSPPNVGVSSTTPIIFNATVTTTEQCAKSGARVWLWGTGYANKWVLEHTTNTKQKYTLNPSIDGNSYYQSPGTNAAIYKNVTTRDRVLKASVKVDPKIQVLIPGEYRMILHAGINF